MSADRVTVGRLEWDALERRLDVLSKTLTWIADPSYVGNYSDAEVIEIYRKWAKAASDGVSVSCKAKTDACAACGGFGLTGERDEWGFGKPCPTCHGSGDRRDPANRTGGR